MTLSSKISINFCNRMIESLPCLMFIGGLKKINFDFLFGGSGGCCGTDLFTFLRYVGGFFLMHFHT